MQRFLLFRIGLLSVIVSFMLFLGVLAFPITASAHTANTSQTNIALHPNLGAHYLSPVSALCVRVRLSGSHFHAGVVHVVAFKGVHPLFVSPANFFQVGSFLKNVVICKPGGIHGHFIVLRALGPLGGVTNDVTLYVPAW